MSTLLDKINSPEDFRSFDAAQLRELCEEVRSYMVDCCASNPGHLASSLGAVELTVGVHKVFNTPVDKFVFDVGHQAYAHKILTGRREAFRTKRMAGGISGFPSIAESPYDAFGVGHSSTSISAALGMAEAIRMKGEDGRVIALIGDGALTGGLAFEGMNNAGDSESDLLIILNDNNHSIDDNIGALHKHLLRLTTHPAYNRIKNKVWDSLGDKRTRRAMQRGVRSVKSWMVRNSGGDLFESLGFRYFGPIDGNDIGQVVETLEKLRDMRGPRVLHCMTVKGKGYAPAEADPTVWHAPGKFDPETGERIPGPRDADRYQDVFGEVLCELAEADDRVVGITPAMASGCGMSMLAKRKPSRFFDVGIEEEHAVTFSAGLAASGMIPFCNIYSAFSQRAYDQIIHDVALQGLPVILCFDRGGLVGEDGATHHGAFDMAAYRSIPGTVIAAPRNELELKSMMHTAAACEHGPFIIRYPRGCGEGVEWRVVKPARIEPGVSECLREGTGIAVLAIGPCANRAAEAADAFREEYGWSPAVYDVRYLKPIDEGMLEAVAGFDQIVTVEDGCVKGGLFGAVAEYMTEHGHKVAVAPLGMPDRFIGHDRQAAQRAACGIDMEGILAKVKFLAEKNEKVLEK